MKLWEKIILGVAITIVIVRQKLGEIRECFSPKEESNRNTPSSS